MLFTEVLASRLTAIADKLSEAFFGRDISRVSAPPAIFRSARKSNSHPNSLEWLLDFLASKIMK